MQFFGEKTISWFDVWSLEHFVSGISVYGLAWGLGFWLIPQHEQVSSRLRSHLNFAVLIAIAYGWESIEHYLEAGYTGVESITYWFQGVEFWGNRLITDPLLMVLGGMLASARPQVMRPARLFSVFWLIVHIGVFPHSMYLHRFLH
jgi:hypothetical protein